MLSELSIRNFAIIDDLQIRFDGGLTILSGETGAGKSIIINAVNLLLGDRAKARMVRSGATEARIEALFQIDGINRVTDILKDQGYDAGDELLIRRVISVSNRHRVYINGHLATMQTLNAITANLASISGQHVHQTLLKEEQHLLTVDQFGGLMPLRAEVGQVFHTILPLLEKLKKLKRQKLRQMEQCELLTFQQKEIETAAILTNEDVQLEQERLRLKNSERLYQTVYECLDVLYDGEGAVVERLGGMSKALGDLAEIDSALSQQVQSVNEATYRLEDTAEALRGYLGRLQSDPARLEAVEERLDTLNRLKRKYGGSLEKVLAHLITIGQKLARIETLDDKIETVMAELDRLHAEIKTKAQTLSGRRRQSAKALAHKAEEMLATLKMANTRFDVVFDTTVADGKTNSYLIVDDNIVAETGLDKACFLIAPNVGEQLKPLAEIASGGELSRVVLALKAILAQVDTVQTVVFDEVDAGIGGGVAEVVGSAMAKLAKHHQVIGITHLPQIAKFGQHHFRITKKVAGGRTVTVIEALNEAQRVEEMARMLGGEKITAASLAHAREMMKKDDKYP
jgi:DNA repair protein RecN (Recombination protein N)